jgi:hypothetical protein
LFPLTIYNDGNTPLFISGISSSNSAFSTQNFSSKTINANSSEVFNLIFSPIQVQLYSTQISVQSNASSGTNSISLNANGTSNSSSGIKIQPNLGNYTPCNNSNSTRDLTNYNKWLYTDYITNQFKFKVESIDSAKGVVSFVVKQCDNNNFKKYYTIVIYESDPINSPPIYQAKPNDADATISLNTKFQGHDTKTYVAIITDSSLGGNYYCTQDISISW